MGGPGTRAAGPDRGAVSRPIGPVTTQAVSGGHRGFLKGNRWGFGGHFTGQVTYEQNSDL